MIIILRLTYSTLSWRTPPYSALSEPHFQQLLIISQQSD
jgi:hypothetical protein